MAGVVGVTGHRETITVVRPAGRDRHGDPSGQATEHSIAGVVAAPTGAGAGRTAEDVSTGDQVTDRWDLYLPAGADIRATDRVRRSTDPTPAAGASLRARAPWIVSANASPWQSPFTGWEPGAVVQIERQTG